MLAHVCRCTSGLLVAFIAACPLARSSYDVAALVANGGLDPSGCVYDSEGSCLSLSLIQTATSAVTGKSLAVGQQPLGDAISAAEISRGKREGQLPDIGGIIGSVANAAQGAAGGALANALNSSLSRLDDQVDRLLEKVLTQKDLLLESAKASWESFTVQLNQTLFDTLSTWVSGTVSEPSLDWNAIPDVFNAADAAGMIPESLHSALNQFVFFYKVLRNATELSQNIIAAEDMTYAEAEKQLGVLNSTLVEGVAQLSRAADSLKSSFKALIANIPGLSLTSINTSQPDSVRSVFQSLQGTVDQIADSTHSAISQLQSAVSQASRIALGHLAKDSRSGAPRMSVLGGAGHGSVITVAAVLAATGSLF